MEQTSHHVAALRSQCEQECEGIIYLHSLAVQMANARTTEASNKNIENMDPQSGLSSATDVEALKFHASVSTTKEATSNNDTPTSNANTPKSQTTIQVQITTGPHASSKFLLRPKTGTPCFIGRSKGKKFIKNGISLYKDAEVSTTHGKFLLEGGMTLPLGEKNNDDNMHKENEDLCVKLYFIDVGSTNGTFYNGEQLEPNTRFLLREGMELRIGNSILKITFG